MAAGLVLVLLALAPSAGAQRDPASAQAARATTCDRFAAPNGSDAAAGTLGDPFGTVQQLVNSLGPGQTGCLLAGTYAGAVRIARGGSPSARLVLAAYPGQHADVVGRLEITRGANYVTVRGLSLDGANASQLESPMIDSNHDTFSYDDVTNDHTGVCFGVGSAAWGWATGTLITHSRIHDCGQMTPGDNYQHGLYIGAATDSRIEWNLIYDNAARGIQLYPDAEYTTIDHNIIDGNGEGILVSGTGGEASSHTNIYDNVVSNSRVRHDVESWWPKGNPVGVDNLVHDNCLWRGREGAIGVTGGGLRASNNAKVNPMFVNARAHDYRLRPTSPCLFAVGDVAAAVDGIAATIPVVKHTPFTPATRHGVRSPASR
ncbi:MAG: right-handed parallel beta-helix repeat-containing protein [Solirubrobacterales bacterium]|nr:right-handed parallel beta-helix repeat-containing protein [Solirubrobacterales bacterium]